MLLSRCEKYLSGSVRSDITIEYNPDGIAYYADIAPHLTAAEHEVMYTTLVFYTKLLDFGGFMLHSSAVEVDGEAYLFSAPSGTGKSTHTAFWLELFGGRARIINDDKPAIRVQQNGIFAYGTPWSGKNDISINEGFPIKGICVLERSADNFIHRMDEGRAIFSILDQTFRPDGEAEMNKLLGLLDKVITTVPVYRLGCNISTQAAQLAYDTIKKDG